MIVLLEVAAAALIALFLMVTFTSEGGSEGDQWSTSCPLLNAILILPRRTGSLPTRATAMATNCRVVGGKLLHDRATVRFPGIDMRSNITADMVCVWSFFSIVLLYRFGILCKS